MCRGKAGTFGAFWGMNRASRSDKVFYSFISIDMSDTQVLHFSWEVNMPTKNPRINVVVDPPLYELIEQLAEK